MADLFDDLLAFLGHDPAEQLASFDGGHSASEAARLGAVLTAPVVLAHFDRWAQGPVGSGWLMARIPAIEVDETTNLGHYLTSADHREAGDAALNLVMGEERVGAARAITTESGLDLPAVDELMQATAWGTLACLARRFDGRPDRDQLSETFREARGALAQAGWTDWIDRTVPDHRLGAPATAGHGIGHAAEHRVDETTGQPVGDTTADHPVQPERIGAPNSWDPAPPQEPTAARAAYPPPVAAPLRQSYVPSADAGSVGDSAGPGYHDPAPMRPPSTLNGDPAPVRPRSSDRAPAPLERRPERAEPRTERVEYRQENNRSLLLPVLVLLGAAALGVLLWRVVSDGDGETVAAAGGAVQSDAVTDGAGDDEAGGGYDQSSGDGGYEAGSGSGGYGDDQATTGGDSGQAAAGAGEIVRIESAMDDPLGLTPATGTSVLAFNESTGEICYEMTVDGLAAPYDGHIHVGPAGVKGGIVIDFGLLEGNPTGCLQSTPTDIAAILGDSAGHYVELHDAGGVTTIRSQLTEGTGVMAAPETDDTSGGAYTRIEAGALRLIGEVPDQVTIDKLLESFADIDLGDTQLVNELQIVDGAPRPSGRIVVDDTILFEVDSDQIADSNATALRDLATILRARPAWNLTVIGHTDNTGTDVYNLELSLRRAEAVRDALVADGVPQNVLTVNGAGSTDPIDTNDTDEGRANNRRIELVVTPG